jgi:hypothetical protein
MISFNKIPDYFTIPAGIFDCLILGVLFWSTKYYGKEIAYY